MNDVNTPSSNQSPSNQRPSVELRSNPVSLGSKTSGNLPGGMKNKKTIGMIIGAILILLIVGLGIYAGLRRTTGGEGDDKSGGIFGELPLGGVLDNKPQVSGLSGRSCETIDRRPIGVMLAGDPINRPVSGFAKADLVWELPVLVSDVTRLLAVYQCGQPGDIGSVRSARHDYLFLAAGVDAVVGHWGGSYHALNRIAAGEFESINALTNPFNAYFRKNHLPAPYNGFTTYEGLWNALQKLGYRTTTKMEGYKFKDDIDTASRPASGKLSIAWPGAFRVHYEYDQATNRYQRFWAGVKQLDGEDNAPVAPSVVAIMRAANGPAEGPGGYNDMKIEGEGELDVYQDGQVIRGRWKKNENEKSDPVHFLDEQGNEIVFTRGQVWVMAVEPSITVTWEGAQPITSPANSPS